MSYDFIEDDHKQLIYFTRDETLDLTEEFNKHVTEENVNGPIFLTNTFLLDEKIDEDYIEFYHSICDAVFNGDEECTNEALKILSNSCHVAGLVKHFLIKWIDMIAISYTNNILDKSIGYLEAILRNPYTVNSDMNIELKHVCQLLSSLLVGSINDEVRENGHYTELEHDPSEYATYDSNIVSYDGNNGIIDNNNGINIDEISSDSNMKFDENNAMLIENFSMESEKTGRTLRDELIEGFEDYTVKAKLENHEEASKDSTESTRSTGGRNDIEDEFNALLSTNCASTIKCTENYVDAVCKLIGMCGSKWLGIEHYLTVLIISEVENYLKINKRITGKQLNKASSIRLIILFITLDYEWLGRLVKGLWSLGEFSFRELLVFFEKVETRNYIIGLKLACDINCSAIYLRGKRDIFFYEFLYEVCGDKLLPFLVYYAKYLLNHNKRIAKIEDYNKTQTDSIFKIAPKKRFIGYRIQRLHPIIDNRQPITKLISQAPKTINIHYGHKISTKKMKKLTRIDEKRDVVQNPDSLYSFNQRVVIVKGRYLKSLSNEKKINYYTSFHNFTL